MKRLSDYKDDEALDLLGEIIEPIMEIAQDAKVKDTIFGEKRDFAAFVKTLVKDHRKSVIEVMAVLDNTPVAEYHCDLMTLPLRIYDIITSKTMLDFFSSLAEMASESASISVLQPIEEKA